MIELVNGQNENQIMHVWYVIPVIVCENDENAAGWALVQLFLHTTTAVALCQAFVGQHKSFPRSVTQMPSSSPLHFILMVGEKYEWKWRGINSYSAVMEDERRHDEHGTIIITFRWSLYFFTFGENFPRSKSESISGGFFEGDEDDERRRGRKFAIRSMFWLHFFTLARSSFE